MASPAVRLVTLGGSESILLVGGPRRLTGKVRLVNDTAAAITVSAPELTADVPAVAAKKAQVPTLDRWVPTIVPPGEAAQVSVRVALDPLTPPGIYSATLLIDGRPQAVELQVLEDISLSLSPSEVVVTGDIDVSQSKPVVITNTGNVALAVSHVGPVELTPDERRPSLLERLGVTRRIEDIEPVLAVVERDAANDEGEGEEEADPPTVEALIDPPALIQPGEARPVECAVTVRGTIDPGLRYRADGALYTTDLRFVVVPPQTAPLPSSPARATGKRSATKDQAAKKATEAQGSKTPRKKSAAPTRQQRRQS